MNTQNAIVGVSLPQAPANPSLTLQGVVMALAGQVDSIRQHTDFGKVQATRIGFANYGDVSNSPSYSFRDCIEKDISSGVSLMDALNRVVNAMGQELDSTIGLISTLENL